MTVLCAVMAGFLGLYAGYIQANRDQLASLPEVIPVNAHISCLNGSHNIGLQIKGSLLEQIEASGLVRDMVCTVQMAANFAPETQNERISLKKIKVAGVNDLAAYPSVLIDCDMDFIKGQDALCAVSNRFMETNNLHAGDEITLDIYRFAYDGWMFGTMRYEYLAARTLKIVGGFDSARAEEQTITPDVIAPIGWVKSLFAENGVVFYADSASFFVKDPLSLNEFKAGMKSFQLLSVNPQTADRVSGDALVVNDETFIRAAESIRNNLRLLNLFFPLLIAVVLLACFLVSHITIQSRRSEFAILRSMGVKKASCLAIYMAESTILAATGVIIGAASTILFLGAPVSAGVTAALIFLFAYFLGVVAAVSILGRVNVITLLTKTD